MYRTTRPDLGKFDPYRALGYNLLMRHYCITLLPFHYRIALYQSTPLQSCSALALDIT